MTPAGRRSAKIVRLQREHDQADGEQPQQRALDERGEHQPPAWVPFGRSISDSGWYSTMRTKCRRSRSAERLDLEQRPLGRRAGDDVLDHADRDVGRGQAVGAAGRQHDVADDEAAEHRRVGEQVDLRQALGALPAAAGRCRGCSVTSSVVVVDDVVVVSGGDVGGTVDTGTVVDVTGVVSRRRRPRSPVATTAGSLTGGGAVVVVVGSGAPGTTLTPTA